MAIQFHVFLFFHVYDGPTVYHPLLLEKSGFVSTPFAVNSSRNQVLIRFASSADPTKTYNGFLTVYSLIWIL